MFCMKCGKKIDDDSKFCPFCGNVVANSATNAGVQQNINPVMQTVKFFNKKIMIGVVSCIVAVAVVIGGVKLLTGGFGKTIAEQLFLMSWTELIDLDEKEFKSSLRDEGITYEQGARQFDMRFMELRTKSVSPFMGYDSYFGYHSENIYDDLSLPTATMFAVTFETKDDYEDGKDDILRYLDKSRVKGYDAIVADTENPIIGSDNPFMDFATQTNNYLLDISTIDFNMLMESMIEEADLSEEETRQIRELLEEEENAKELQEMMESVKVYKFSTIAFVENKGALGELLEYYFDDDDENMRAAYESEDFPQYGYCIMNSYMPLTDEDFQSLMSYFNYDTIDQKEIDLDEVRKTLDVDLLDSGVQDSEDDLRAIYFMENHGVDIKSDMDVSSDELKRIWYIRNYGWDSEAGSFVDLSDYHDSRGIYCALTFNYDVDEKAYFQEDLDKMVYLSEKDFNPDTGGSFESEDEKRLYFMKNYSYDTVNSKAVDQEVVDALIAYDKYVGETLAEEGVYGYNLIYIDDNNIPECLVWTEKDQRVFVLSYKNGAIESVTHQQGSGYLKVIYTPKSGKFDISVFYGSAGLEDDIFTLDDSFHLVAYADSNRDIYSRVFSINGQEVSESVYDEALSDKFGSIILGGTSYRREEDYNSAASGCRDVYSNVDKAYSTLLSAYDALGTTTYVTYVPEVAEFDLTDGTLVTGDTAEETGKVKYVQDSLEHKDTYEYNETFFCLTYDIPDSVRYYADSTIVGGDTAIVYNSKNSDEKELIILVDLGTYGRRYDENGNNKFDSFEKEHNNIMKDDCYVSEMKDDSREYTYDFNVFYKDNLPIENGWIKCTKTFFLI